MMESLGTYLFIILQICYMKLCFTLEFRKESHFQNAKYLLSEAVLAKCF